MPLSSDLLAAARRLSHLNNERDWWEPQSVTLTRKGNDKHTGVNNELNMDRYHDLLAAKWPALYLLFNLHKADVIKVRKVKSQKNENILLNML